MKKFGLIFVLVAFCIADVAPIRGKDGDDFIKPANPMTPQNRGTVIDSVGDIRAIMGPFGKSICVSEDGNAIAVIYGGPTDDVDNFMEIRVAYSMDNGATFSTYGPFSPDVRRCYPGVDGSADFDAMAGELYFTWHETLLGYDGGEHYAMIEENIPSSPSPSVPILIPGTSGTTHCPWEVCVAVNLDDPYHVVVSNISYVYNGNYNFYAYVSTDGGYSWTDSINIGDGEVVDNGHLRFGTGDYLFANMHKDSTIMGLDIPTPYYNESTDGGFTWSTPAKLPVPYLDTLSNFWWHEFDCEVINDEPWTIHTNTGDGQDSMWLFHGTGSPGAWTWDVIDVRGFANDSVWIGDTLLVCNAIRGSGYPQIAYDPVNNIILAGMSMTYFKANMTTNDTIYDGWYPGGIYSTDGGSSWTICGPLSDLHGLGSAEWGIFEIAHGIVNGVAHTVFVHETELQAYFFGMPIVPFTGVDEASGQYISAYRFDVTPSVASNTCRATFTMPVAGNISLKVYDVSGRVVDNVFSGHAAGEQAFNINTSRLASGTYFVVLETEHCNGSQKIITLH
jgi:hypothetical protein